MENKQFEAADRICRISLSEGGSSVAFAYFTGFIGGSLKWVSNGSLTAEEIEVILKKSIEYSQKISKPVSKV